jgi:hypothetical protein
MVTMLLIQQLNLTHPINDDYIDDRVNEIFKQIDAIPLTIAESNAKIIDDLSASKT